MPYVVPSVVPPHVRALLAGIVLFANAPAFARSPPAAPPPEPRAQAVTGLARRLMQIVTAPLRATRLAAADSPARNLGKIVTAPPGGDDSRSFQIERHLGSGVWSHAYQGIDTRTGDKVAVKLTDRSTWANRTRSTRRPTFSRRPPTIHASRAPIPWGDGRRPPSDGDGVRRGHDPRRTLGGSAAVSAEHVGSDRGGNPPRPRARSSTQGSPQRHSPGQRRPP